VLRSSIQEAGEFPWLRHQDLLVIAIPIRQEHLLMHIVGQIGIAEDAQSGIEDLSAVLMHQVFEVRVRQNVTTLPRKRFLTIVPAAAAEISACIEKLMRSDVYRKIAIPFPARLSATVGYAWPRGWTSPKPRISSMAAQ
jgi:hypothetical protein